MEDVAAAFGTRTQGQLTGTFGDAAFFSFDSTKLINVPLKAGFLAVRDPGLLTSAQAIYEHETAAMTMSRKFALVFQGFILLLLENQHKGTRSISDVRRTIFTVQGKAGAYSFKVLEQEYRAGT